MWGAGGVDLRNSALRKESQPGPQDVTRPPACLNRNIESVFSTCLPLIGSTGNNFGSLVFIDKHTSMLADALLRKAPAAWPPCLPRAGIGKHTWRGWTGPAGRDHRSRSLPQHCPVNRRSVLLLITAVPMATPSLLAVFWTQTAPCCLSICISSTNDWTSVQ